MNRFYTVKSGNRKLGLPESCLQRAWESGQVKHDAVEIYSTGRERPLFSELTLAHFKLDLDAKAAGQ